MTSCSNLVSDYYSNFHDRQMSVTGKCRFTKCPTFFPNQNVNKFLKKCRKDLETSNHQVRPLGPQDSSSGKPAVISRGKHADLGSLLCQVPSRPIVQKEEAGHRKAILANLDWINFEIFLRVREILVQSRIFSPDPTTEISFHS